MSEMKIGIVVRAIDRATAPLRKINRAIDSAVLPARKVGKSLNSLASVSGLNRIAGAVGQVGTRMGTAAGAAGRLGLKMAALGGVGAWLFKSQLIDTAAAFERYQTILETIEGSSEKASIAMDWISDFAATTPFELAQVTDAFVKLRAFGLDPTGGLLRTLGDTAAAMGKDMNQAVEAIADAITGENERLKEFGIKARTVGKKVAFEYTAAGKTMRKVAETNNREMIQSVLTSIWNEKYGGAMDKLSGTWEGMISNLSDQWERFKLMIMKVGAFDFLKGKIKDTLDTINALADSGELQKIAADVGQRLVDVLKRLWEAGKALATVAGVLGGALAAVAGALGGWENLGFVIAGVIGTQLVVAIWAAASAFIGLGTAIMTTPVGWIIGAVALIAGAGYLISKSWGPLGEFFRNLWAGIKNTFDDGVRWIADKIAGMTALLPAWARSAGGLQVAASGRPAGNALPTLTAPGQASAAQIGGQLHIKIDSEGRPRVQDLKSSNPDFGIDVDAGPIMVGG